MRSWANAEWDPPSGLTGLMLKSALLSKFCRKSVLLWNLNVCLCQTHKTSSPNLHRSG